MGIAEVLLIVTGLGLLSSVIAITIVGEKRRAADLKKKESSEIAVAPINEPVDNKEKIARYINVNRLVGTSEAGVEKYVQKVLEAKTQQEIDRLNLEKSFTKTVTLQEDDIEPFEPLEFFGDDEEEPINIIGKNNKEAFYRKANRAGLDLNEVKQQLEKMDPGLQALVISGLDKPKGIHNINTL